MQCIRRYATEGAPKSPSRTPIIAAVLAGSAAGAYYLTKDTAAGAEATGAAANALKPSGKKAFTGGDQGFIDLKLESVENVNHNTKRFRFALPEKDDVSGLQIACECRATFFPRRATWRAEG